MKAADPKAGDQQTAAGRPDPAAGPDLEGIYRERLRECMHGESVAAFARRAEVPDSTLRSYVDGSSLPNWENAVKIARAAGRALDWFASGAADGPLRTGELGASYQKAADFVLLPLYDVRPSAGHAAWDAQERITKTHAFSRQWLTTELRANPDAVVLVYVDGDSMEPTLSSGDVVMVDRGQAQLTSDGMYVFTHGGALLIKRLQRLAGGMVRVISDNPRFTEYDLRVADFEGAASPAKLVGRVLWSGVRR